MPKFTFVGDPLDNRSGPNRIVIAGEEFTKNVGKNIDNEDVIKKLRRNTHFVEGDVDVENLDDDDEGAEDYDNVSNDHLRKLLDSRDLSDTYKSNTSRADLIQLVKANGGLD